MGSTYLCFYGCSAHLISSHLISSHITSHHLISSHLTSPHLTSHHITSHHITSHHITSHHITSHHITSHHITSHHVTVGEDGGRVSLPWLLQVHQSLSLTFIFLWMFHSCDLSLSCHHNLVSGSLFFHFLFFFALPTLPLSLSLVCTFPYVTAASLSSFSVCSKAGLTWSCYHSLVSRSLFFLSFFFFFTLPPVSSSHLYPSDMQQQQGLVERKVRRCAGISLDSTSGDSLHRRGRPSWVWWRCLRPPRALPDRMTSCTWARWVRGREREDIKIKKEMKKE